ncbi:hypothetical protein GW813_05965 [bacterium]|nr:hypothetical protein [bacterium]
MAKKKKKAAETSESFPRLLALLESRRLMRIDEGDFGLFDVDDLTLMSWDDLRSDGFTDMLGDDIDITDADFDAFVSAVPVAESVSGDYAAEDEEEKDRNPYNDAGYQIVAAWDPKTKRGVANVVSYVIDDANFEVECAQAKSVQDVFDRAASDVPG